MILALVDLSGKHDDSVILTELNAESWEHGDVVENKFDRPRDMSGQIIRRDLSKSPAQTYLFGRRKFNPTSSFLVCQRPDKMILLSVKW